MNQNTGPAAIPIPLRFETPPDLASRYATNFVVQHTGNEFVLSFYEVFPPLLLGSPEDNLQQLNQLEYVKATCVARIILSPAGIREFAQVLTTSLSALEPKYSEDS